MRGSIPAFSNMLNRYLVVYLFVQVLLHFQAQYDYLESPLSQKSDDLILYLPFDNDLPGSFVDDDSVLLQSIALL